MGTHLLAYFINTTFGAALANVNVVNDDVVTKVGIGDRFLCPVDYNTIQYCAALGTTLTRALVTTPSLEVRREVFEILPRRATAVTFSLSGLEICDPFKDVVLQAPENIIVQTADSSGAGVAKYALIWLKKAGPLPAVPDGDIRVVRSTGTTTLTINTWSTVAVTLDKDLEPGQYALVGFIGISANVVAVRVIIPNQNYRPGMPGLAGTEAAAADFDFSAYNPLMYYLMGEFPHTNIPQFQFLSSVADTVETVFLYLIKVGAPGTQLTVV